MNLFSAPIYEHFANERTALLIGFYVAARGRGTGTCVRVRVAVYARMQSMQISATQRAVEMYMRSDTLTTLTVAVVAYGRQSADATYKWVHNGIM